MAGFSEDEQVLVSLVRKAGANGSLLALLVLTILFGTAAVPAYFLINGAAGEFDPSLSWIPTATPLLLVVPGLLAIATVVVSYRTRQRLGLFHRHREYDLVISGSLSASGPFQVVRSFDLEQIGDHEGFRWRLQVFRRGVPVVTLIERGANPPPDGWADSKWTWNDAPTFEVIGEACVLHLSDRLDGAAPKPMEEPVEPKRLKKKKKKKQPSAEPA